MKLLINDLYLKLVSFIFDQSLLDTEYRMKITFRYFVPVFSDTTLLQSVIVRAFCVNFFNRLRKFTRRRPSNAHRRDENINTIVKRDTATQINWNRRDSRTFQSTRAFNLCKKRTKKTFSLLNSRRPSLVDTCVLSHPNRDRLVSRNPKYLAIRDRRGICFDIRPQRGWKKKKDKANARSVLALLASTRRSPAFRFSFMSSSIRSSGDLTTTRVVKSKLFAFD